MGLADCGDDFSIRLYYIKSSIGQDPEVAERKMPLEAACHRQRILQVGFESSGKIKAAGGDPPQAVSFIKNNFEEENSYNEKI